MRQPNPKETSADDSQNSGNHQSGLAGDWMRVLALVVVAALILRFDYSALDFSNLFSKLPSAFGFSTQPKATDSPLVPVQPVQPSRADRKNCH